MTFDPFKQSKLMTAYTGMKCVDLPDTKPIEDLEDLKKLAGVNSDQSYGASISASGSELGRIQRERGIKAGDPEWFRLWFAKPLITGEKPYDGK